MNPRVDGGICLSGAFRLGSALGVLTWTSWAAPGSVGRAARWSSSQSGHVASERGGAGTSVEVFSRAGVRGHDEYWRTRKGWRLMKYRLVTSLLVVAALVAATFSAATTTARPARAADSTFYVDKCPPGGQCDDSTVRWRQRDPEVG